MTSSRVRLWDAERHRSYIKDRDEALEKRADQREGISVAKEIGAIWPTLAPDERAAMEYLLLSEAKSCVGRCNDHLLLRLVEKGLLIWPPGVRPVLTDDLVTTLFIPPALQAALEEKKEVLLPPLAHREAMRIEAAERFQNRLTPLSAAGGPDPFLPSSSLS